MRLDTSSELVIKEVSPPDSRWCSSGHEAPEKFARAGPGTTPHPTRFFRVTSQNTSHVNGTYCEPCLIVAHYLKKRK